MQQGVVPSAGPLQWGFLRRQPHTSREADPAAAGCSPRTGCRQQRRLQQGTSRAGRMAAPSCSPSRSSSSSSSKLSRKRAALA